MAEAPALDVALHGDDVGRLERRTGGLVFTYAADVLEQHPRNRPLLSCSLPVDDRPQAADAFFEGLLPEGQHRADLAARADVAASDAFGLLARYGRDIAGAVTLRSAAGPSEICAPSVLPLTAEELEAEVVGLPERALGVHHDSELSLAGLQDKLLLVALGEGMWGRPVGGHPSTHILKIDDRRFTGVVAAEAGAMAIARAVGLTSVGADLVTIAGQPCLIVERFDRRRDDDGTVQRIHQEDACQALGVLPGSKYETRHGGGGPEFSQIAELLDRHSTDPIGQMDRLVAVLAFTAIIGNADAHGKNLAFLHREPGVIELSPLYDQVPTKLWSELQADSAMTIAGGVNLDRVTVETVASEAKRWRHSPARAATSARMIAEAILSATDGGAIDPDGPVAGFVRARAEHFLRT
jgi:serine/threonine-protein kinase HipA